MPRILHEHDRHDFPFPRIDSPHTSTSSGSLQSGSGSSQTKSLRSSSSSISPLPRPRGERDSHDSAVPGVPSKLLSHLMTRDHHSSRSIRTALAITTERLESETRRADDAERRVLEVLRRLRAAHEATMLAQAEASRAKEELTLYKYRLEDAQREILRAQELLNELEQQKVEAEAEAARARSTARRYREQQVIARAREEGRQEGLQEGLSRGRDVGFNEARADNSRERKYGVPTVEEVPEEEEEEEEEDQPRMPQYRSGTPGPDEFRVRTPGFDFRSRTPGPSTVPSGRVTPPQPRRPPSRLSTSRTSQRVHVSDTAHHAAILPVPTLVTPLNAPSPSHSRAGTPTGMPIPHPAPRSLDGGEIAPPIPIHEPIPSPAHPPIAIPPDGFIPYTGSGEEIMLPPPHELSRPITPGSPTPPPPILHSVEPPPQQSTSSAPRRPQVRSREYAYMEGIPPEGIPVTRSNANRPMSPQSKASTTISQFDLVGAPKGKLRVSTFGRSRGEDRQVMSPRGPRPREDLPAVVRPTVGERQDSEASERSEHTRSPTNPLERLFKKRYRNKSYKDSPPSHPVIPDIVIESPSTPSSARDSVKTTITHPHLLSPEHNHQPLAPVAPTEEIIVMRTEIPGYNPTFPVNQFMPQHPDFGPAAPVIPPLPSGSGQFPMGFVPLTPPMPPSSFSNDPVPVPANTPIPVPPPSNPIPVPSNTPVPILPPSNPLPVPSREAIPVRPPSNPLPVPSREAVPIPYDAPLPIPHDEPLPVPHRRSTDSPRQARYYAEAPLPAGVVYPEPPSRRSQTPASGTLSPRRGQRLDVRSPGASLSPLPLQFFAPLRSDTTTSES